MTVVHILRNGRKVPVISGFVIRREGNEEVYKAIERMRGRKKNERNDIDPAADHRVFRDRNDGVHPVG